MKPLPFFFFLFFFYRRTKKKHMSYDLFFPPHHPQPEKYSCHMAEGLGDCVVVPFSFTSSP